MILLALVGLVETLPRSIHEFGGVTQVCTFRGYFQRRCRSKLLLSYGRMLKEAKQIRKDSQI